MSSPPSCRLLCLPSELIEQVIKQLGNKADLSNTRLACKVLSEHATKELFKDVSINPEIESLQAWTSISQDDAIRSIPRHAIIHTYSDIDYEGYEDEEGDERRHRLKEAVPVLSKFSNLESIEIGFTVECEGENYDQWLQVQEKVEDREELLTCFFQAIKARASNEDNRTIRKLTILNLQNCPIPGFTTSDLFRAVMSDLDELHISTTQERSERGEWDYKSYELQEFPEYFCSDWLKPVSANLTSLSIYGNRDNWGPFPGHFDPSGISFPKLKTLALGYYTLAHDNDLDWILSIKSLRKLILHKCMIASRICILPENFEEWNVPTNDWIRIDDAWNEDFDYRGTWSQYLDRIVEGLPELVDFRFDHGFGNCSYDDDDEENYLEYALSTRDQCGATLFVERYTCFNNNMTQLHWEDHLFRDRGKITSYRDDESTINLHEENLAKDRESLNKLLERLRSRV